MGETLDGKKVARAVRQAVKSEVSTLLREQGWVPGLATIMIGDDPASRLYLGAKEKACREVGIATFGCRLPSDTTTGEMLACIAHLNARPEVHGVLVQLPLPAHVDGQVLVEAIAPGKDVDGLHPLNQGRLLSGRGGLRPCTPRGVMRLLDEVRIRLDGKKALVVGRSALVGTPLALLLLARDATVTWCHSHTLDLEAEVRQADIVVAALGQPGAIKGRWIKRGAVVIDVGITRRADGTLCGDVEFAAAKERAAWITPVPGGVGPMTVAMLLVNTLEAAGRQRQG